MMQSETKAQTPLSFLIVDRDRQFCNQLKKRLPDEFTQGCTIVISTDEKPASSILRTRHFDIILVDLETIETENDNNQNIIYEICRLAGNALIIATNCYGSVSLAVDTMGAGAHDFIAKPFDIKTFAQRIIALGRRHRHDKTSTATGFENKEIATKDFSKKFTANDQDKNFMESRHLEELGKLVGTSAQIRDINKQIEQMANSCSPVLITGESGTGKKICAKFLHKKSFRSKSPFIVVNCSTIPHELMESEIFGVVQGAYTGANKDRPGAMETADGGVLFLDEIGELSLRVQAKLLGFLQTGVISRVGENLSRPVNARVICATDKAPTQLIAEGKFREDLFYHLHVLNIHMPPLRQRSADILPLAQMFLQQYSAEENKCFLGFSSRAQNLITDQEWFGNIGELQNFIRTIVAMFDGGEVNSRMIRSVNEKFHAQLNKLDVATTRHMPIKPMWRQEQIIIETALARYNGNISLAAAALEISPSTIYRKKQAWEQNQEGSTSNKTFVA